MSKIKSLPVSASVRVCPRIASLGKRATPSRATDTVRWPRSPAPSRRWSWRCTSTRQGTIFIFPASRTLGGPTCSGSFSSPASARPRRRRTCFTSTISMIRIVPCCCPSRRGRAKSCVRSFRRRWRISARNCPSVWTTRSTSRSVPNCRIVFRPCVPAHQADGQDRRERGLQPRYG